MIKILLLHDKRGYIARSLLTDSGDRIDIDLLKHNLESMGATVEVRSLHDLEFPTEYRGWYVIYPSSEDAGLFYKGFIEDILLRLQMDGAILLPSFEMFRAHHNKVFMEMCRSQLSESYRTLASHFFYGADDLSEKLNKMNIKYPIVLKTSAGAGSSGVCIAKDKDEAIEKAKKMSKIYFFGVNYSLARQMRHKLGKWKRKVMRITLLEKPRLSEKMIFQPFIPDLLNDYKVLVFDKKYYLLKRAVRENDFRASGSGKLSFPEQLTEVEEKVLNFAKGAYEEINAPLLSIDIAFDGDKCHMIEFQCINFGPYTLQFSEWYYMLNDKNVWERVNKKSILEEEMAVSYVSYVRRQ